MSDKERRTMINDTTWTELQQAEDMAYFRADLCLYSSESYTLGGSATRNR